MIPVVLLIIGVAIGVFLAEPIRGEFGVYIAVACMAGLDTVFGGIRSEQEGKFDSAVLVTGFISNILIALLISWFGEKIGINTYLVCVLIFGQRIFVNLSVIRRILLSKWTEKRRAAAAERNAALEQSTAVSDS